MAILEVSNLKKTYGSVLGAQVHALNGIHFSLREGEFVAIMGESGSGKSTLLNIIATFDKPTEGSVLLRGKDLKNIPDKERSKFRRDQLGFVFQDFNLLERYSVRDNILLPLVLANVPLKEMERSLFRVTRALGIQELLDRYPYEISGGQKQRTAVARAIITEPSLLLADEPTGALDSKSADALMETFTELNEAGQTILMVTHSVKSAAYAERILFIRDGLLYNELHKGQHGHRAFMDRINETLSVLSQPGMTPVQRLQEPGQGAEER